MILLQAQQYNMVQLITYDLNNQKDYSSLYKEIKDLGDWIRDTDLDSVWFVSTSLTVGQTQERLRKIMDDDDNMFITKLNRGEYAGWMNKDIWPWLRARL